MMMGTVLRKSIGDDSLDGFLLLLYLDKIEKFAKLFCEGK